ncbi:MAG: hypothetical protein ACI4C3_08930 [Bacteroides sp.]
MLCISLPSCSDDDEKDNNESTKEVQQGVLDLLNLKMNLCLVNLQGEPTKATFGVAMSEANSAERIYYTKDLESAKKRYQLLFHKETKCSSDGNTYTLANKQGTATFATGSGNNGELAIATFDVPGLKGLVTKVHFIDYTQRGENTSEEEFNKLAKGDIVEVSVNNTKRYGIAMGPLKGSNDTWVLFAPDIQKDRANYRPTGYTDQCMNLDDAMNIKLQDYIQSCTATEYLNLFYSIYNFLFHPDDFTDSDGNLAFLDQCYRETGWLWKYEAFYFQVNDYLWDYEKETSYGDSWYVKQVFNRYHLRLAYGNYDARANLWNLPTTVYTNENGTTTTETQLPGLLDWALPLWTNVFTVTKGDNLQICEYEGLQD